MSVARKVAWNTLAQTVARVVTLALTLVATILLTRQLGVEGYGDFTAVIIYVSLFSVLFDLGIATLLVRSSPGSATRSRSSGQVFALRLLLAVAVGALAARSPGALPCPEHDQLRLGIAVALPTLLFSSVATTLTAVFRLA